MAILIIDNMQELKQAIWQLVSGYPKQATSTIQSLTHTQPNFYSLLTKLITSNSLPQKQLNAALITLNSLVVKEVAKTQQRNYLKLQQLYTNIKIVLVEKTIQLEYKKYICPALSALIFNACSSHSQILQIKKHLQKGQCMGSGIVALSALVQCRQINRNMLIQCIIQLFDIAMLQVKQYLQPLYQNVSKLTQNLKNIIKRVSLIVDTLYTLLIKIFKKISQPYQHQALQLLTQNPILSQFLYTLIYWQDTSSNPSLNIVWLTDIVIPNQCTIQCFTINTLKQKCLKILSHLFNNTSQEVNLRSTAHPLLSKSETVYVCLLREATLLSKQFGELDQDYFIGGITDAIISVIAAGLQIPDLLHLFVDRFEPKEIIEFVTTFCSLRDTDVEVSDECFEAFLEGFVQNYTAQINRYAINWLVQVCCKKLDWFPCQFFTISYNNLIQSLTKLDPTCQLYNKLLLGQSMFEPPQTNLQQSVLCLLILHKQIDIRQDFQSAISQLLLVLDFCSMKKQDIILFIFFITKMTNVLIHGNVVDEIGRYIQQVVKIAETDQMCASMCYSFIEHVYRQLVSKQELGHVNTHKYVQIVSCQLYPQLLQVFKLANSPNYQQFYLCLLQYSVVSAQCHKLKIQKISDYILTQQSQIFYEILVHCCHIYKRLLIKDGHDQLLAIRVAQVIQQCVDALGALLGIDGGDVEVSRKQFGDYCGVVCDIIVATLQQLQQQQHISPSTTSQILQFPSLVHTLIQQQHFRQQTPNSSLPFQVLEHLLPVLLKYPYGQYWLTCICEFVHRIEGKLNIAQSDSVIGVVLKGLDTKDEGVVNQVCILAGVILGYEVLEGWSKVVQAVRAKLANYLYWQHECQHTPKPQPPLLSITFLRLFHLYLHSYPLQQNNPLLQQLLPQVNLHSEKYTTQQTVQLLIGFQSAYKLMSYDNIQKLIKIVVLVLNKLILNQQYFGKENQEEVKLRKLGNWRRGREGRRDPFAMFRGFIGKIRDEGFYAVDQETQNCIKNLMSVTNCNGHPRKLYSIVKPKP